MSTAWLWVQILFMETILGIDTWYTFPEIHFWCAPLLVYMASIVASHFPYMHVSAEVGMPDSNEDLLSNHSDQICLCQVRIRLPTLALKPRGDVTRSPKQGYQWSHKWTCVNKKIKTTSKHSSGMRTIRLSTVYRGGGLHPGELGRFSTPLWTDRQV